MKNRISILLIFSVFFIHQSIAHSNELDKFEGTWHWKSNDSTFTVILKKVDFNGKKFKNDLHDSTINILIGWHELTVKVTKHSSAMHAKRNSLNYKKNDFSLTGGTVNINSKTGSISLMFKEIGIENCNVRFNVLPGGDKAQWELRKIPNIAPGIVILTKIK